MSALSSMAIERRPMLHVSLIVEALRAHPRVMFAVAALAQGALWTLVPALVYTAPPGELPLVLGVGREWLAGSPYGPPLAYWAAEIAFGLAGGHVIGVYLLSQLCVVATYWAMFALGRRIVGAAHAAMAILLMTGISVFAAPTVEFGPAVLAMPLCALSILFAYRGLTGRRRFDWLVLGLALGALMLTTYTGLTLLALVVLFVVASARGRSRLAGIGPWAAAVIVALITLPHLLWLERSGFDPRAVIAALPDMIVRVPRVVDWLGIVGRPLLSHVGLVILLLVAGGLFAGRRTDAPTFERQPVEPFGRVFVYVFALVPALVAMALAALLERSGPIGGTAPLAILSGLAIVTLAGDAIRLHRQRTAALVWLGLLTVPPAAIIVTTVLAPILAIDLEVSKPAADMGAFFTETFHRRTAKPLAIVVGDVRTAGLVALASPDRPHFFVDASPERAPWISDAALRQSGAVIMWTATDAAGTPPAALKARFPEMVPEVPHSFARAVQGRLPLLRIGWAVLRPN